MSTILSGFSPQTQLTFRFSPSAGPLPSASSSSGAPLPSSVSNPSAAGIDSIAAMSVAGGYPTGAPTITPYGQLLGAFEAAQQQQMVAALAQQQQQQINCQLRGGEFRGQIVDGNGCKTT